MQNITTRKSFLGLFSIFPFSSSRPRVTHTLLSLSLSIPALLRLLLLLQRECKRKEGKGRTIRAADIRFSGTPPGLTARRPPAVFPRPPPQRYSLVIVWIRRVPRHPRAPVHPGALRAPRQRPNLTGRAFFLNPYICSRATIPLLTDPRGRSRCSHRQHRHQPTPTPPSRYRSRSRCSIEKDTRALRIVARIALLLSIRARIV